MSITAIMTRAIPRSANQYLYRRLDCGFSTARCGVRGEYGGGQGVTERVGMTVRSAVFGNHPIPRCTRLSSQRPISLMRSRSFGTCNFKAEPENCLEAWNNLKERTRFQWVRSGLKFIGGAGLVGYILYPQINRVIVQPTQEYFSINLPTPSITLDQEEASRDSIPRATTQKLRDMFDKSEKNCKIIEIVGEPKTGKSTIAFEYASDYQKGKIETSKQPLTVQRFDASQGKEALKTQYESFKDSLVGSTSPRNEVGMSVLKVISNRLSQRDGFLIVIDGLKKEEDVRDFFDCIRDAQGNFKVRGQIIITSQSRCLPESQCISLSKLENRLTPHEGVAILEQTLSFGTMLSSSHEHLKYKLVDLCDYQPFYNRQVALLVKNSISSPSWYHFKNWFYDSRFEKALTEWVQKVTASRPEGGWTLEEMSEFCIKHVQQERPKSFELCKFLVYLNPDYISGSTLVQWQAKTHPEEFALISDLVALGLLSYKDGDRVIFPEHIRAVILGRIADRKKGLQESLEKLISLYYTDNRFTKDLRSNEKLAEQFSYLQEAVEEHWNKDYPESFLRLMVICANNHIQANSLEAANRLLEDVSVQLSRKCSSTEIPRKVKELRKLDPLFPATYGKFLHYKGKILFHQGKVKEAEKLFENAIKVRSAMEQGNHLCKDWPDERFPDGILFKRNGLGWVLIHRDKYKAATELYNTLSGDRLDDAFHQRYCHLQLWRAYYEWAESESDETQKKSHHGEASKAIKKALGVSTVDEVLEISDNRKQSARFGEYLNAFVKSELTSNQDFEDLNKLQTICRNVTKYTHEQNTILADAEGLLAEACLKMNTPASIREGGHAIERAKAFAMHLDDAVRTRKNKRFDKISTELSQPYLSSPQKNGQL